MLLLVGCYLLLLAIVKVSLRHMKTLAYILIDTKTGKPVCVSGSQEVLEKSLGMSISMLTKEAKEEMRKQYVISPIWFLEKPDHL